MNFIELCQKAQKYSGVQGSITSTVNVQSGSQEALIIDAVRNAWIDIQNYRSDFKFLRDEVLLQLVQGTTEYSVEDVLGINPDFSEWKVDRFIYDYSPLEYVKYDNWVLVEDTTEGEPQRFTVRPSDKALFFNSVDGTYALTLQYYRDVQELTANTDTPILPNRFHYLIVYGAVMDIATSTGDLLNYQRFALKYSQALGQLMRAETPKKKIYLNPIA